MSEKLTAEQIQHISRLAEAARFSGSMKVGTYELTALCDLALSAADAEQRGRAQGLAEAVEVLTAYREYDKPMCCDGRECGCHGASVFDTIEHYIRALSPSPDHVLVPREPTEKMLRAAIDTHPFELGDMSPLGLRCSPQDMFRDAYRAMIAEVK